MAAPARSGGVRVCRLYSHGPYWFVGILPIQLFDGGSIGAIRLTPDAAVSVNWSVHCSINCPLILQGNCPGILQGPALRLHDQGLHDQRLQLADMHVNLIDSEKTR